MASLADDLRLTADERRALRRAGLVATDILQMTPDALAAAADEVIDDRRAARLVALAGILDAGVAGGMANRLMDGGIRDREDLASRSANDLFLDQVKTTARTHPIAHDAFAQAIYLAGVDHPDRDLVHIATWTRRREESGFDPMLLVWRYRHGDRTQPPRPTTRRVRLPTIGVTAPLFVGGRGSHGMPVTPLGQKDVVADDETEPRLLLGHWMWSGGHGPFVRLEDLRPGDGVQIGADWFRVADVEMSVAPADLDARREGHVVLATPPHRRAGIIGLPEMLPPVQRGVLQVVARAQPTDKADCDTAKRPVRRIPGAY